jgi:glycolate oxidase iron-sulfur subunit
MAERRSLDDLTAQCIRCGFCLESCPTFVLSGDETQSPRGRITLARTLEAGSLEWSDENKRPFDSCLGCRACEPACPSGVRYAQILEQTRERFGAPAAERALLAGLTDPRLFRLQAGLASLLPDRRVPAALSRLLTDEPPEAEAPRLPDPSPWPPLEESALPPVRGEVALLLGCVMRVLYPDVHEASRRLLRRIGFRTRDVEAPCCGALHAHAGLAEGAERRLARVEAELPPAMATDSAGCGSWLREGRLADRTMDVCVFLHRNGLLGALPSSPGLAGTVATYHDACHLAHGQGVRSEPRELLAAVPGLRLVALHESDFCCGSAGTFNVRRPRLARRLLDRKWGHVRATGADTVVSGNPGCQSWLAQRAREDGSSLAVRHTLDLLEASFSGLRA